MKNMPYTLFIADLHLQSNEPAILQLFYRFLQQQQQTNQADALYILGDLFNAWVGDDDEQAFHKEVKSALRALTNQGIPVYLMPGNRDFLLGKHFAETTGCQLLRDPILVDLYGHSVLLTHGDCLCTQDVRHQYFRQWVQKRWVKRLLLAIPLNMRQKMAQRLRQISQQRTQRLRDEVMDVTPMAVQQLMTHYQTACLIHGHTHRPAIHVWSRAEKNRRRMVLGAWHQEGSVLVYYADGHAQLLPVN